MGPCSSPVNACEQLLYLFTWCSKWYGHNRWRSWIKGLKPPSELMCSAGAAVQYTQNQKRRGYLVVPLGPLYLPQGCVFTSPRPRWRSQPCLNPNTWTQWPHPSSEVESWGEGGKLHASIWKHNSGTPLPDPTRFRETLKHSDKGASPHVSAIC